MEETTIEFSEHFANIFQENDFDILLMIGGYGSGKSFTGFLKVALLGALQKRRMLIVRKVYSTLKDSCFEDLKDAIYTLDMSEEWKYIKSPYEFENKVSGTQIIFKGMDDWRKLKSIKNIDLILIEEADELTLDDIKELKKRLRTNNIRSQMIFMCNPVSRLSSIYKMFFTKEGYNIDENLLYKKKQIKFIDKIKLEDETVLQQTIIVHHSTYKDNPFLPANFVYELESEKDPRIRRIARDGKFGADGDLVLYNAVFEEDVYERYVKDKIDNRNKYKGIDWGFSISYTCGLKMAVNPILNELYVYWEYYEKGKTTQELIQGLQPLKEDNRTTIYADSASSQTIADFYDAGFNIDGATKGKGSVEYHEQLLRSFSRIVIDINRCPNTKAVAEECVFQKDKNGEIQSGKYNLDPHPLDAMSYGLEEYEYIPLKERIRKKKYVGV
ncbi:PBSX family phage terminase large subunit [uncultured Fusobacterium sp.]|uniref:PBSX family phage terminase large subunit n=1 Tax=uncultured Fusobacterium sp. TaxID=159267 RepID=UPI0015A711BD|nr:PBSX family phage terminase large subunit [uncultured Fusobacterium sp.]DAQ00438.1 MAG TPA: terminase large subunit [Caudoviricetes sp.]